MEMVMVMGIIEGGGGLVMHDDRLYVGLVDCVRLLYIITAFLYVYFFYLGFMIVVHYSVLCIG
jgi:hypothetical protein